MKVYIAHLTNKSKETNCKSSLRLCYSHFSTVEFYGVQIREFECTQFWLRRRPRQVSETATDENLSRVVFDSGKTQARRNVVVVVSTTNKVKQRNGTLLFEKARQGRRSSLDNWTATVAPAADIRIHSRTRFSLMQRAALHGIMARNDFVPQSTTTCCLNNVVQFEDGERGACLRQPNLT